MRDAAVGYAAERVPTSEVTMPQDLPIPDFDQLPEGSIQHRIRSLDEARIQQLLEHEQAHANRPSVVMTLEARLQQLRSGAEPSGGAPDGLQPEQSPPPTGDAPASPDTQGPPVNPPSHGDPTNPSQPRG